MAASRPIRLYSHPTGPNPWKVAMILEELHLPYETTVVNKLDLKKPAYEKICINGRAPAIEDPNTGITLWESGAIIEYLIEIYDRDHTISFAPGSPEYFHAKQWLYFQVSGQGPYFGQAAWFKNFHPETVKSAQDRYINEIRRVSGVLERALEGKEWLVGGKFSYADAAFVTWYDAVSQKVVPGVTEEFPNLDAWLLRIKSRPDIATVLRDKAARASAGK